MAFGISRKELKIWKATVSAGEIGFLTHYWVDDRFPGITTVTKVGCSDIDRLKAWGEQYGIPAKHIHYTQGFPHFDLLGDRQRDILEKEGLTEQLNRFLK